MDILFTLILAIYWENAVCLNHGKPKENITLSLSEYCLTYQILALMFTLS